MNTFARSASLAGYEILAHSLRVDTAIELKRVGLSSKVLADPDALVPQSAIINLLERTARIASCPDFGLRLARRQDLSILGPVSVLIRHAPTVGGAVQLASRYLFTHNPAAHLAVEPVAGQPHLVELIFALNLPHLPPCAQLLELSLGILAQGIRQLAPRNSPVLALLPHSRIGPLASYIETYGCPCQFEAPFLALRISADALHQPMREHNPLLQQLAQSYLDRQFDARTELFSERVRMLVRRLLSTGGTAQPDVAATMAIHPRTMQRRLNDEGHTFEGIVDSVRREKLRDLLGRHQAPALSQVALMLGYSDQGALTRACRRWYGCTPSSLRNQQRNVQDW
ncbi:AraC family transcriptional regulator [Burkholderia stabilis]|uniref:AraC family transcriptional regulator n=2 Tax=Burkholderia stabilis TaxID=95485 RepID=A0A4Q2A5R2_9BURK|nr:AraC family transcriptional regulator [Burkholderia stabilis]